MIYKLITNWNSEKFNDEVNAMLANGWELFGSPFACSETVEENVVASRYCQALTGDDSLESTVKVEELDDQPF